MKKGSNETKFWANFVLAEMYWTAIESQLRAVANAKDGEEWEEVSDDDVVMVFKIREILESAAAEAGILSREDLAESLDRMVKVIKHGKQEG